VISLRKCGRKSEVVSSIQILRAVAALFIVIGHSQGAAQQLGALSGLPCTPWSPVPWGAGVDIFFVISGFIIFYTSERYEDALQGRRLFISHRLARIVPLYWLCTFLFLGLVVLKKSLGFAQSDELPSHLAILTSLLFFPFSNIPLPNGLAFPIYNLGWTLNYELFFYALLALCLARSRGQSVPRILYAICCIAALGLIFKPSLLPFSFWSQPIILEFGMGIGIAVAFRRSVVLPLPVRFAMIVLGISLLLLCPFGQPGAFEGTNFNDLSRVLMWGIPAALIVAGAALGPDIKGAWSSPFVALGNASYSLYLLHPFVIIAFSALFRRTGFFSALPLPAFVGLVIIVASIVAIVSYHAFERPSGRTVSAWLALRAR
jgi:exopolysaccharide production protein ExoZ